MRRVLLGILFGLSVLSGLVSLSVIVSLIQDGSQPHSPQPSIIIDRDGKAWNIPIVHYSNTMRLNVILVIVLVVSTVLAIYCYRLLMRRPFK